MTTRFGFRERRMVRQAEAMERAEERAKRTGKEQLARLDAAMHAARRERMRIALAERAKGARA